MRRRPHLTVLAMGVALLTQACSDTGILIEVTQTQETTIGEVDRLRLFVGAFDSQSQTTTALLEETEQVIDLADAQNLRQDPYKILLKQQDLTQNQLSIFVVARAANEPRFAVGRLSQLLGSKAGSSENGPSPSRTSAARHLWRPSTGSRT